ncbi:MAG: penicillin-binding transpeptidase domain-containing protein [Planctomycetota bacterium]|nr:penicillin-binding transpeptidase domain-containing protein [Planctomycetota bacterium]
MYERRLKVFLVVVVVATSIVVGRLAHLQLIQGAQYRRRAEELLVYGELLPTVRGKVLDCRGRVLAYDEPCFDLCLDYRMLKGPGSTAAERKAYSQWIRRKVRGIRKQEGVSDQRANEIFEQRCRKTWELAAELTGTPRNEISRLAENTVRRVEAIRRSVGGPIREEKLSHAVVTGLDETTAVKVRSRLGEMAGASVHPSHRRRYPFRNDACHIIGRLRPLTGTEGKQARTTWKADVPVESKLASNLPGDLVGAGGVERLCEGLLRGSRGYRRLQRTGQMLNKIPARFGLDVHLTIDIELQRALSGILARPGAIVVLDVPTGEVLAMVSLPTYDLNTFRREFERLSTDQVRLPLLNRAVYFRYPPGSTVKPIAALAGLSSGVITPEKTFYCKGYLHNPDAFRCWIWEYHTGHGDLDVVGALEHSCNVFFYNVGERLGVRRMCRWLGEFGFSDVPGMGLPEERSGNLPDPRSVRSAGEARFLAIGQGRITASPMHVAGAMATIARDGEFRSPLLVREFKNKQIVRRLPISDEHLRLVQEGLYKVVNSPSGTANKYAHDPEIEICGKTGTAETSPRRVDSNGNGRIDSGDRIACTGDTAWFAGFAPYHNPRIAFAVVVEYSDVGGGEACGPIARQVVRLCRAFGYMNE